MSNVDECLTCGFRDGHHPHCDQIESTTIHGDQLLVRSKDGQVHVLPIETR